VRAIVSTRSLGLSDALHGYFLASVVHEPELLRRLRKETEVLPGAGMQISPEQGRFMGWLVRLIGARRCVEIGVFTGYSSLSVALALPADGQIVACDVNAEWTAIAQRYFGEAELAHKFDLRLGPALATLDALCEGGERGQYDFAFIDADKANYPGYYERCLTLLRPGGVIAVDNALWSGKVADPSATDDDTRAIRDLNARVVSDPRVSACLIPIGDGLLLAQKLG
jgi:caffeoyl-CoA O-methyltransferase